MEVRKAGRSALPELLSLVWPIADLLRGDYHASDYGKVMLPMVLLRRLDTVLEPTKDAVIAAAKTLNVENIEPVLCRVSGHSFYNTSPLTFRRLLDDPTHVASGLRSYINGFSSSARETFERFGFDEHITRLEDGDILFLILQRLAAVDLHPNRVSNHDMGALFEEMLRRFSEMSNETAGEHYTPREVVRLMVDLIFAEDTDLLTKPGIVRSLYDPACGTGGMLSVAEEYLAELNPSAELKVAGEEVNPETWSICRADMMIKGHDPSEIVFGNSFTQDGHRARRFDYFLSNPPFGVEWKKVEREIRDEAERKGFDGRFGAGLPRINDGSFLFLQHMISKWRPVEEGGSRLAIVFNGSPLFTGDAGSGESEIRRWIIENDWLEAIIALPDQLFYNTGISTYLWIVTNRKLPERQGKIQLVNAVSFFEKMPKSLGQKRKYITESNRESIVRIYGDFTENEHSKIFDNEDFGFRKIVVERPLRVVYRATDAGVERAMTSEALNSASADDLEGTRRQALEAALRSAGAQPLVDEGSAKRALDQALRAESLDLPANARKVLLEGLLVREAEAPIATKAGKPVADAELRDTEDVPLSEPVQKYFDREVRPYCAEAWVDESKTKIGYEIPFTRAFYVYSPPRALEEIDADIKELEAEILRLLGEVTQ
jgi:type I restriction enzyme M protein